MPTTRRRHVLTETDELARALDEAAKRWPTDRDRRTRLLVRLVEEGHQALQRDDITRDDARRRAVARTAGVLTDAYPEGYLDLLREDWPA